MSSPQLPGTGTRIPTTIILVAMLFPLFMAFAYPASYVSAMHQPAPHEMKVEVIGTADAAQQVARQVAAKGGDALDVSTVPDAAAAREDVMDRETRAAFDPATGDLFVATAGGRQAAATAQGVFQQVAAQTGTPLKVNDLKKPAAKDTLGIAYMYIMTACVTAGYVTSTMLGNLGKGMRLRSKLGLIGLLSVVAAVLTMGVTWGFYGVYDSHLVPAGLVAMGAYITAAVFQLGVGGLLGQAATIVGITVFVILGIPASGVAASPDLMPGFFQVLHRMLPTGAIGELLQRVIYFDGHGAGPWILLLATWLLLGAGLLWLASLRSPHSGEDRGAIADQVEHARKHPDEPLLAAYDSDDSDDDAPSASQRGRHRAQEVKHA
ncbi:ABC transporter permease [Kocuria tytonis]|uniref:ABC transporter permease n=2 Tax=Kocuria tytonis TaxID=2054280 RepID=A0A495A5W8_9MICC|nr:ABC transporter permease [Kocuria tytonis]